MTSRPKAPEVIARHVPDLVVQKAEVSLVGTSGLYMNKFSNKAQQQIKEKQQGGIRKAREPQDAQAEFLASLHVIDGTAGQPNAVYGIPSISFKKALVATGVDHGWSRPELRRAFFIEGHVVPIEYQGLRPGEDYVRVKGKGGSGTMMRYRGFFDKWRCRPTVIFAPVLISLENLLSLFNWAGFSNGVGDWRPQHDGNWGQFKVATEKEWKEWEPRLRKIQSA